MGGGKGKVGGILGEVSERNSISNRTWRIGQVCTGRKRGRKAGTKMFQPKGLLKQRCR